MPCTDTALRRSRLEVADILRAEFGDEAERSGLSLEQRAAARDIMRCRTAALGGHLEKCTDCDFKRPAYNSCRNRHCPKCQALASARWLDSRLQRVLPTHHFHVVFTLPGELHAIARCNRALVFDLLLRSAAETLLTLARDPQWLGASAQLGITTVLHTWTRDLRFHPHAHCIVTGGGLSLDQRHWVEAARDFLFPVRVLGAMFRGKLLAGLANALRDGRLVLPDGDGRALRRRLDRLYRRSWVVYAKRPFGGPEQVFRYLGRYTHRIAISNSRLLTCDSRGVTFRTRGDAAATLSTRDFARRFLDHVLPTGFVKIRHFGLLASGNVRSRLQRARALLCAQPETVTDAEPDSEPDADFRDLMLRTTGLDLRVCPRCHHPTLERYPLLQPALAVARAPPTEVAA